MKKRFAIILITLAILMSTGIVAYAVINYITTETQTSVFTKKEYFEMECSVIFAETSEVGPGESVSINPMVIPKSSVDMYVLIRVEMPVYNGGGLYELDVDTNWSLVDYGENLAGKWVEVYRYDTELKPDQSTIPLADKLTMKNMTLAVFSDVEDINVSMTGFVCRISDVANIDEAWGYIKSEAGM